jgi:predicted AAA+ superfamily ATPase
MKIERTNQAYLKKLLDESQSPHDVIVLGGARQVGKTTLIQEVNIH